MRVGVVIPAGGAGQRMGGVRKALLHLAGVPVLARSIAPFLARTDVVSVAIALPESLFADPPQWLRSDPRIRLVAGGAERSDSVRNAIAVVGDVDVIVVHDAARPLVSAELITRCVTAAAAGSSVIAAIPVVDTIKEVTDDGRVLATPDRRRLRAAQTPQAFPATVLRAAHARALEEHISATDDAALVARFGAAVLVVPGDADNIKITTPADLAIAEALLARHQT